MATLGDDGRAPKGGRSSKSNRDKPRGGRREESREVQISKACSYILRHGAEKEGLKMRADGFIKVADLLSRPKLKNLSCDFETLKTIVDTNDKQRYKLLYEPNATSDLSSAVDAVVNEPPPDDSNGTWWIRANQGHTLAVERLELVEVKDPSEVPMAVHGTTMAAWNSIKTSGLSRMKRNHIHLAKGLVGDKGVISGMRSSSVVHIFIDVPKAFDANLKFYFSDNDVILSPGNEEGHIPPSMFQKVTARVGKDLKVWDGSKWVVDSTSA